jgi:hypothetical protein
MRRRRENDEMGEKVSSVQRSGGRKGKVESTKVDLGPLIFRRILPDMGPQRDMHVGGCRDCLKQPCDPV